MEITARGRKFLTAAQKMAPVLEGRFFVEEVGERLGWCAAESLSIAELLAKEHGVIEFQPETTPDALGGWRHIPNPRGMPAALTPRGREFALETRRSHRVAVGKWFGGVMTAVVIVCVSDMLRPIVNEAVRSRSSHPTQSTATTLPSNRP